MLGQPIIDMGVNKDMQIKQNKHQGGMNVHVNMKTYSNNTSR